MITHVALVASGGHIDVMLAKSYDQALHILRERAEGWDWELHPGEHLDRQTATLEQLSELYAVDEVPGQDCWVSIAEVWSANSQQQEENDLIQVQTDKETLSQLVAIAQKHQMDLSDLCNCSLQAALKMFSDAGIAYNSSPNVKIFEERKASDS